MFDNLDATLTAVKVAVVTVGGALVAFLGWRFILLLILVFLMIIDYASGTWAARQNGTWKSSMAREGIGHKGGMVLVIGVCVVADIVLVLVGQIAPHEALSFNWPVALFPVVTFWYIITELGSILENAIKMGANIPAWLPKILDATLKTVDVVGEAAIPDGEDK